MTSLSTLYRGSVKDVRGPVSAGGIPAVIFDYSDAFSVFDWGRMPDLLTQKGAALATLGAWIFEKLEDPATWREFSRSKEAFALRRGNRFGGLLNEIGEALQADGLRTHYLGVRDGKAGITDLATLRAQAAPPPREMVVKHVSVLRPQMTQILGESVPDYRTPDLPTTAAKLQPEFPRLVPLEVVFRFMAPEGSSWRERATPPDNFGPWEFPVLESFTKLESRDRLLAQSEALALSGLVGPELQRLYFLTAWVGAYLKSVFAQAGLDLADGKLEWAITEKRELFLVDAIGPDELRLQVDGVPLSKEFLRKFYRRTDWYRQVSAAKTDANWKQTVTEGPPALPSEYQEAASQLYQVLANRVTGTSWFKDSWSLDRLVTSVRELSG